MTANLKKANRTAELPSLDTYIYKIVRWTPRISIGQLDQASMTLACEIVKPKKHRGRQAKIEITFSNEHREKVQGRVGLCEYSGTSVLLCSTYETAALIAVILTAGRLRYLEVFYRPVLRHRLEDVESFEFAGELDQG